MKRHDPDLDHHGTLFAWPEWVQRMIRRKPTKREWQEAGERFSAAYREGVARYSIDSDFTPVDPDSPFYVPMPEPTMWTDHRGSFGLSCELDPTKDVINIITGEVTKAARPPDPYEWFDPKQAVGR